MKQIQVLVIAFVHLEHKKISSINRASNIDNIRTDSHEIMYPNTLFRAVRSKTIRCPAVHPRIRHIRENTPPGHMTNTLCA